MKHYGDITKMNGATLEKVWCIVGGSPCQDLSVAGKRAGLSGERSGLFMEQIRIIKEMRKDEIEYRTDGGTVEYVRLPRYMVWENVVGALSSGKPKGADFQAVLEETARIAEPTAVIPGPPKGKWSNSGAIVGDGWSIAWTVRNARFYGVPQRRRRIALVADFGGDSAPEILFESKGVQRNNQPCKEAREEAAGDSCESVGLPSGRDELPSDSAIYADRMGECLTFQECAGKPGGGKGVLIQPDRTGAITAGNQQNLCAPLGLQIQSSVGIGALAEDEMPALTIGDNPGWQNGVAQILGFDAYNQQPTNDSSKPLTNKATDSDHIPIVCIEGNGSRPSHRGDGFKECDDMYTLNTTEMHAVCAPMNWDGSQTSPTLTANNAGGSQRMPDKDNFNCVLQPIHKDG